MLVRGEIYLRRLILRVFAALRAPQRFACEPLFLRRPSFALRVAMIVRMMVLVRGERFRRLRVQLLRTRDDKERRRNDLRGSQRNLQSHGGRHSNRLRG